MLGSHTEIFENTKILKFCEAIVKQNSYEVFPVNVEQTRRKIFAIDCQGKKNLSYVSFRFFSNNYLIFYFKIF